ncbi:MAG: hypothetical protein KDK48_02080 [Chlamydiia bacterium]|nr:hypothetical protein [Chlamydiia bacterium]
MTSVGGSSPTNPVQQVLQQAQKNISDLEQSASSLTNSKAEQVVRSLQENLATLQNQSGKDLPSNFQQLSDKMLDKLSQSLFILANNTTALQQMQKTGAGGNLGNILQGLQEEVEKIRDKKQQETRLNKKRVKVEKYELIEFLNSTEKELEKFVAHIKENSADEDELLQFMLALMKKMESLKNYKSLKFSNHLIVPKDSKELKRLIRLIDSVLNNSEYAEYLAALGKGMGRKERQMRFYQQLAQLRALVEEIHE